MKDIADLVGRILIGLIFVYEAFDSIFHFQQNKGTMAEFGITWMPDFLLVGLITILILGATLVLIGYFSRVGGLLLLLYWLPFTCIVYSFWNDPESIKQLHTLYFMRNMAIVGGLLLIIAHGSGKYSVKRLLYVMRLPK